MTTDQSADQHREPAGDATGSSAGKPAAASERTLGLFFAFGAYLLWGGMPLLFVALEGVHALDILAWRIVFSLVICLIVVTAVKGWGSVRQTMATKRDHRLLILAGALISINWGTYILAATTGRVLEASLGYFINPLATILLGVLVLQEKLRPLQWFAVAVSGVAVVVLTVEYGAIPWVSLTLAASFAVYGLVKNKVGSTVPALTGLTIETIWLTLPAVAWIGLASAGLLGSAAGLSVLSDLETWRVVVLVGLGVATVAPLLFFAGAASRLPLSTLGMFQYLAPLLIFITGYWVLNEEMSTGRWWGFGLVWVAVIFLMLDGFRATRNQPSQLEFDPVTESLAVVADTKAKKNTADESDE